MKRYLFRGALDRAKIAEQHARLAASLWPWAREGEHVVLMRGPGGEGEAVMVVKKDAPAAAASSQVAHRGATRDCAPNSLVVSDFVAALDAVGSCWRWWRGRPGAVHVCCVFNQVCWFVLSSFALLAQAVPFEVCTGGPSWSSCWRTTIKLVQSDWMAVFFCCARL